MTSLVLQPQQVQVELSRLSLKWFPKSSTPSRSQHYSDSICYYIKDPCKFLVLQHTYYIWNFLQELYSLGGRSFMVLNLAPVGCYPAFLVQLPHESSDIDPSGCMMSYNNAVNEYNSLLKAALGQARQELQDANVIYVDIHSSLLELFQKPTSHGSTSLESYISNINLKIYHILGLIPNGVFFFFLFF